MADTSIGIHNPPAIRYRAVRLGSRALSGWKDWVAMRFDSTIGLGSIINLAVMLAGGIAFLLGYEHRITIVESAQAQIERRQADQESRIGAFERQLNGIVFNAPRKPGNEFSQTPPVQ